MIKLSLQNTWAHKRRLVGTFMAVLIGVGFLSGTLVLGDTLRDNFDKLFRAGFAGTDVVVRPERPAGEEGAGDESGLSGRTLDASLVDDIEQVDGVRAAAAQTTAFGQLIGGDGELLGGQGPPTFAANWVADDGLNPYNLIEGDVPTGPLDVVIDSESAEDGKIDVGDTVAILLPARLDVTVTGIAEFGDGSSKVGVTYAFFSDEGTATHLTKEPGTAGTIVVAGEDGISQEDLLARVEPVIGAGNEALTGEAAADEAVDDINKEFLSLITGFLVAFAGIALFVATFSIYNTFSIIVAQRTRESALMRAIGATRGQVLGSTMIEALLIGVVASVAGLGLGLGFASGLKGVLNAFGLSLPAGGLTIKTSGIVIGLIVGIVVTLIAAIFPALRGSRVRPIEALRASAVESAVPRAIRSVSGIVLAVAGLALMLWAVLSEPDNEITYAGIGAAIMLMAMLVLGPVIARPVAGVLGLPFAKAGGITGELSRENAMRNPRRTASTAAALLVGVAVVVLVTVFIASIKSLVSDSVDKTFGGDLVIAREGFGVPSLPTSLATDVADLDGVSRAIGLSYGSATVDEDDDFYANADVQQLSTILDLDIIEGSADGFGDDDIAISEDIAKEERLDVGDPVDVVYSNGVETAPRVAMIYRNADIVGGFLLPRSVFAANSTVAADAIVFVDLEDGASLSTVREEIKPLTDAIGKPAIQDRAEYTETVSGQLDQLLGLVIVMLALAIIIAAMGIANTIALSVHERTRELGLLRAVGTTRKQLRRLVRWEAVIVSTFGTIGGIALGVGLGWVLTRAALADSASSPFAVPVGNLVTTVILGIIVGVLAAWRPSYRAAKMDVLEAVAGE